MLAQNQPSRCVAITTSSHALLLKQSSIDGQASKIAAEFLRLDQARLAESHVLSSSGHGTLGIVNLEGELFISIVTAASPAASVRDSENVLRILEVEFCIQLSENSRQQMLIRL